MQTALALSSRVYRARPPSGTVFQRTVAAALPAFRAEAERTLPSGAPTFVTTSLGRFTGCGDFARGFVEFDCERCDHVRRVAFSCKTRGLCPSCGGKRMTELAAHLVDEVLPRVPMRQFVLTVPFELRARLAFDAMFAFEVRRAFQCALRAFYRFREHRTPTVTHAAGETGGITAIQRFGSGMNLHVHFHTLVLDGVFVAGDGREAPRFREARSVSGDDVATLLGDVVARLARRGVIDFDDDAHAALETLAETEPLGVASCLHRIALGPRRGQRVERLGARPRATRVRETGLVVDRRKPKARFAGFDLDASVRIPAFDRPALERLCRYLLRPPLSDDRLRVRDDGRVEVALKSSWPDGTTHLVFSPLELTEKAAALVPRPHANLLVYFGVLAANAKGRDAIVAYGHDRPLHVCGRARRGASRGGARSARAVEGEPCAEPSAHARNERRRSPRDWATLMQRGLAIDVLDCPTCGGRLRLGRVIDDGRVASVIAGRLGLARVRAGPPSKEVEAELKTTIEFDPDFVEYDD